MCAHVRAWLGGAAGYLEYSSSLYLVQKSMGRWARPLTRESLDKNNADDSDIGPWEEEHVGRQALLIRVMPQRSGMGCAYGNRRNQDSVEQLNFYKGFVPLEKGDQ